jgi:hypothetical protein
MTAVESTGGSVLGRWADAGSAATSNDNTSSGRIASPISGY